MEKFLEKYELEAAGLNYFKKDGQRVFVKYAKNGELIMAELINTLSARFTTLILPTYSVIDKEGGILISPFYHGEAFIEKWLQGKGGGSAMGLDLAEKMPLVLRDLLKVDAVKIEKKLIASGADNFKFDFAKWREQFMNNKEILREALSEEELKKAGQILSKNLSNAKYVFNNGDFYPGNFIRESDKIILIDWEIRAEDYRANIIDYLENVIAFLYVHMWENAEWQNFFLKEARKNLCLNFKNFQKAVLIKSYEQAKFFRERGVACYVDQLNIFKKFLNEGYFKFLEKETRPNMFEKIKGLF